MGDPLGKLIYPNTSIIFFIYTIYCLVSQKRQMKRPPVFWQQSFIILILSQTFQYLKYSDTLNTHQRLP